jgi:hypothetical protein
MSTNLDKFKADLQRLSLLGNEMLLDLNYRHLAATNKLTKEHEKSAKELKDKFERNYQKWFTESAAVIKQLIPDRLNEFVHLYHGDGKRKQIDGASYNIQDWLNGIRAGEDIYGKKRYDDFGTTTMRFHTQVHILQAAEARFDSSLFDIAQMVRADLFDTELDAARELVKNGFLRGAGAIAGVVVEKHLAQVCTNHNVTTRKQHPTISDFNDLLKTASVLDVPTWRQLQRLGDIRNLCDHNKQREPTKDEVVELIDGTEKLCKTLF